MDNNSIINILPEFVANQIAAGEVVNRPASAVKELLENAVDAGATEIELHTVDAGKTLIQVIDNGCGMNAEDAQRCFLPHATSKLSSADDLHHIRTMGFRGEALASIAAVAQVELHTRQKDSELGTKILIEGGKVLSEEAFACPPGSCFMVKNLYFNTPARRQFLKSEEVEYRYIEEEFNRIALAHPEICFSFYRNNQKIYFLESGNLKKRIVQLMGKAFESRILKVSEFLPDIQLSGYICSPEYSVKGRSKQYLFVNRRHVRHAGLSNAVEKAYIGLLPDGKSPAFFLFLEIPPENIDVNIHPTKTEIRFKDEKLLYGLMLSAIKHALGINQMRDTLDFESSQALPYSYRPKGYVPPVPKVSLHDGYNPFENKTFPKSKEINETGRSSHASLNQNCSSPNDSGARTTMHAAGFPVSKQNEAYRQAYAENFALMQENMQNRPEPDQLCIGCFKENEAELEKALQEADDTASPNNTDKAGMSITNNSSLPENQSDSSTEEPERIRIFQIFNSYIVTPLRSGIAIIDQEAASERVIYNDFSAYKEGTAPSQSTLFPQTIELSAADSELLQEMRNDLNALGWSIEWLGGHSFMVNAMPVGVQESRVQELLENLMISYTQQLLHAKGGRWENIAVALARQLAVKRGTPLSEKEICYLASRLFSGIQPEFSPSGKKVFRILSEKELDSLFGTA